MIEDAIQAIDIDERRRASQPGLHQLTDTLARMRLDVFTQVPHAFGWLTEQKPLATVLGTELELRLFNYRDTTPLRAGQVDDSPYGGGAGMVLRVDVVAAALEAVYGDARPRAGDRADAAGAASSTRRSSRSSPPSRRVAVLSSRFEGFDARIVDHLCTDAISIGPYVLSGGELPAMVLRRRDRAAAAGRARGGLRRERELQRRARRRARVSALHAARRVLRLGGARRAPVRRTTPGSTAGGPSRAARGALRERRRRPAGGAASRRSRSRARTLPPGQPAAPEPAAVPAGRACSRLRRAVAGQSSIPEPPPTPTGWRTHRRSGAIPAARRASAGRRCRPSRSTRSRTRRPAARRQPPHRGPSRHSRNPVDRLTRGLPDSWRVTIDWVVTIVGRGRDRPARQGVRRQPVPHPVVVDGADAALRPPARRAARRATRTGCSRTASSTTSAIRVGARSSSSRRRRRRRSSAARAGRSSSA